MYFMEITIHYRCEICKSLLDYKIDKKVGPENLKISAEQHKDTVNLYLEERHDLYSKRFEPCPKCEGNGIKLSLHELVGFSY
jgi:hypothetical protein